MKHILLLIPLLLAIAGCGNKNRTYNSGNPVLPSHMFEYSGNVEPRWVSFENMTGAKGRGAMENNGAKGHPSDSIRAGSVKTLMNMKGPGIINRMWFTISDRSPVMLRSLVIKIFWDNMEKPAVSVPFGDFFGTGLGRTAVYENALFANPEGRSFNCFIQMPFRKSARVELVNESETDLPMLFYDIDLELLKDWDENFLYFHGYWHRDTATTLARDFEIMPAVKGKGRFLGSNIGINANPDYRDCWWGEGEVKIYIDGDTSYPTMAGTGTEDYIGTAWGQGQFFTRTTGCLVADSKNRRWAFYRYHISDPVYFKTGCRVTIQQMGGNTNEIVTELQREKVKLIPVTVSDAWTNFYRSDDLSATCYFYLDSPSDDLPDIQSVSLRTWNLTP